MVGELDEVYLSELREENKETPQQSLFDFSEDSGKHSEATTIAVISKPNETGVLDLTDEFMPSLGMPAPVLTDFQKLRGQMNEMSHVEEHNKAFEKCDLENKYRDHLFSDEAQEKVDEIIERLHNGEDITLVCFEKSPKKCHRHVLKEHIERNL